MVARAETTAATRARLLQAAWEHFAERPFDDVRLAGIAADAHVSLPTLHAHFGAKGNLFVASWQWHMDTEGRRRDAARPGDVTAAVRVLYRSYEADGDAVLRLYEQEERIPEVHEMLEAGRRWHRGWVERTLGVLVDGASGAERERRLVAIVVATDLLAWKLLRREMRLDRATAERIVREMVTRTEAP